MRDNIATIGLARSLIYKDPFMQNPIIVDLLSYWERLRDGRLAPLRSDVDPREIKGTLEHTFVIQVEPEHGIRFRLAGTALCSLLGMELRGMPASSLFEMQDRDMLEATLHDLLETPKIVELQLENKAGDNLAMNARMLLLPLQGESGALNRVLGCLVTDGKAISAPHRFTIKGQKTTRIVATQTAIPPIQTSSLVEDAPSPEHQSATPDRHALYSISGNATETLPPRKSARPHLRLIQKN